MKKKKITHQELVRLLGRKTGFRQTDIDYVLFNLHDILIDLAATAGKEKCEVIVKLVESLGFTFRYNPEQTRNMCGKHVNCEESVGVHIYKSTYLGKKIKAKWKGSDENRYKILRILYQNMKIQVNFLRFLTKFCRKLYKKIYYLAKFLVNFSKKRRFL